MTTTLKTLGLATLLIGAVAVGTAYAAGPGSGFGPGMGMAAGQGPCANLTEEELAQRQELRAEHWTQMKDLRDQHRQDMIDKGFTPGQGPRAPQAPQDKTTE